MRQMRFTGFKRICEQDGAMPKPEQELGKSKPKRDFEKSNMDGVLARDLNIVPFSNDKEMDMVSPGSAIQFKGHHLKRLNKLIGIDGEDVAMKLITVKMRNKFGVLIQDITGGCDKDGLNTGREYGPFAGQPFPHAPCSPTNGRTWWISAKDWDHIRMPLPPGQGQQGGGGGGLGGPGGGLGAGLGSPPPGPAPSAPPGGGAAGGGSPPPPPA